MLFIGYELLLNKYNKSLNWKLETILNLQGLIYINFNNSFNCNSTSTRQSIKKPLIYVHQPKNSRRITFNV